MVKHNTIFSICLIFVSLVFVSSLYAQEDTFDIEELKKSAPKVFFDCDRCDIDFIRTEITFVNYVWDRQEADVHILITTQSTGGGGREYTIAFIGLRDYEDLQNSLTVFSNRIETQDEIRNN